MSTLRSQNLSVSGSKARQNYTAMDNPPSFYDEDIKKRLKKYNPSIEDRALFKRVYQSKERRSILTGNDNFPEVDAD